MKCRIKSSGEIVDVINWSINGGYTDYIDKDGIEVSSLLNYYINFEPIIENNIDWGQRRYEIAKCAIAGLCSSVELGQHFCIDVADIAIDVAEELIKQLKEKQNEI